MKKHLVVFHPAIAPYRIDFFNSLNRAFDSSFYMEFKDPLEQSFDQCKLKARLEFEPKYLSPGFAGVKNLRLRVLGILWREKPDIVFISEFNLLGLLVILYKLITFSRFRIVTVCDDNMLMLQTASFVKRITRSVMLRFLYAVILADKNVCDWYNSKWGDMCRWIYFPIIQSETIFRGMLKDALPLADNYRNKYALINKQVILYVGRLAKVKNVSLLLHAYSKIRKENRNAILLIVGDGPLREELIQESVQLNIDDYVIFAGKHEGQELMAHYDLGDIFVLPSSYEPFGTVVNEALLAGCFVFCSDRAGASCLIDEGENGVVFDIDKKDLLVEILLRELQNISLPNKSSGLKNNRMKIVYEEQFNLLLNMLVN